MKECQRGELAKEGVSEEMTLILRLEKELPLKRKGCLKTERKPAKLECSRQVVWLRMRLYR